MLTLRGRFLSTFGGHIFCAVQLFMSCHTFTHISGRAIQSSEELAQTKLLFMAAKNSVALSPGAPGILPSKPPKSPEPTRIPWR